MKQTLHDFGLHYDTTTIFCDYTSAINLSKNHVLHSRTKHIQVRHHFLCDHVLNKTIKLDFVPTSCQLVDIFTKPLKNKDFLWIMRELRICCLADLWQCLIWWFVGFHTHILFLGLYFLYPPFSQCQRGRNWDVSICILLGGAISTSLNVWIVQLFCHNIYWVIIIKKGENVEEWIPQTYVLISDKPNCTNMAFSTNMSK